MTSFQDRFKGKTTIMPKEGITQLIAEQAKPIPKQYNPNSNQKINHPVYQEKPQQSPTQNYNQKPFQNNNQYVPHAVERSPQKPNPYIISNPYIPDIQSQQFQKQQSNTLPEKFIQYQPYQPYQNQLSPQKQLSPPNINTHPPNYYANIQQQYLPAQSKPQYQLEQPLYNQQSQQYAQNNQNNKYALQAYQTDEETFAKQNANRSNSLKGQRENNFKSRDDQTFTQASSSANKFKPYTLREYEEIKKAASTKLGGLGPNLNSDEWQKEKERQQKRKDFAEHVKQFNQANLTTPMDSQQKKQKRDQNPTARQRALEFARNIPKPPINKKLSQTSVDQTQTQNQYESEMERLERQHLQYIQQLDQLK